MMKKQQYTIEEVKQLVRPIFKQYNAVGASIFGSYARGDATENSDVDFLVELPRGIGLFSFGSMKNKLENALDRKVDLVTPNSLKESMREYIIQESKKIL